MIDYSLWEVIENGNAPLITKVVEGVETTIAPTTAEEKAQRRLELKAISNLLIGIPNEHLLKFNSIKDAKSLLQAIEKRLISLIGGKCLQTATKGDTLQGNTGLQGTKKTGIGRTQEGDQAEEGPTNFALMAYSFTSSNSEVSTDSNCSSPCLENVKILKEQNEQLLKDLRTSKLNAIAYKIGLESVKARLLVYKKNESIYEEDIKVLKREIHLREVATTELRRKLELAQKQKDEIQLIVENFENSSKILSKLIDCQIVDKCKTGLEYNVVPPPYTGNLMPLKPDLSFSGLEEFVNKPIVSEPIIKKPLVETSETKAIEAKPKAVRKNNDSPIIEDWVLDSKEENVSQTKIEKKIAKPRNMSYLTDFEEIDGGYVAFGGNPKGGKITGRGTIKTSTLDFKNVYFVKELKFNLFSVSQMCDNKNSVLFIDTECIVLSPNFKLTDENVLLKVPRKKNMYNVDLKNIVPKGGLTCLFAEATSDESKLWHRRLGHINFQKYE
ncbi:ribonuclease H-like domain-containing protein [Tanacetum coccineum]